MTEVLRGPADRPQVFVAGTWRDDTAQPYAQQAKRVGLMIAEAGCDMACGPGTGISAYVIAGFRHLLGRAGVVRYYLPAPGVMEAVGEVMQPGADVIERTDLDYPMRNLWQIGQSQGLVVVTGGDGTLEEILPALVDYRLPVGVLAGSGPAARGLELLLDVFPDWVPLVRLGVGPQEIAEFVLDRIT